MHSAAFLLTNKTLIYEENHEFLNQQNPALKFLFAVGGWNAASDGFKDIVASDQALNHFVTTSIDFLK